MSSLWRKVRWSMVVWSLALPLATRLAGQSPEVQTTTRILGAQGTVVEVEEPAILIGMDAYDEVLRSGEYLVGPGDRFLVHMTDVEEPFDARVLAEGGLFIPRLGRVQVGARRLREVRAAIDSAYRANVVLGQISVELSELRQFPVTATGLVKEPGATVANGVRRVGEVIDQVNGLQPNGSTRNIRLIRTHGLAPERRAQLQMWARSGEMDVFDRIESRRIDLDFYKLTGLSQFNPFVQDGDIIVVPSKRYAVRTMGAWGRPLVAEYVQGDRISDLVTLSMGPSPTVDPDGVFLFRFHDEGFRQVSQKVDLAAALAEEPQANLALQHGDWMVAYSRPGFLQPATVSIAGEVVRPGPYIVDEAGTPLRTVIEWAGGYTDEASLPKARVARRLGGEDVRDPEFDRIRAIPPAAWDKEEKRYFNMKSREKRGQMVVDFVALFEHGDESQNILVRPGDQISIPASQRTVLVTGQAAYPGAVPYVESYTVSDYIERAGGFGWRASKDVEIIKARTGERVDSGDVDQIEPGDRIWVKEKPVRDWWLTFTQGMQVTSQVATVALLFVTIIR